MQEIQSACAELARHHDPCVSTRALQIARNDHARDIEYDNAIVDREALLSTASRELGLKSGTMTTVSKGKGQSKRVQLHIAKALNTPASTLWPEVFSKDTEGAPT